jgi:hypothetical protein
LRARSIENTSQNTPQANAIGKKKKLEGTTLEMIDLEEALAERQIYLRWRAAKKAKKSST